MLALCYIFQNEKGSAENAGVQVSLIFKSLTEFKFYLSMAAASFQYFLLPFFLKLL